MDTAEGRPFLVRGGDLLPVFPNDLGASLLEHTVRLLVHCYAEVVEGSVAMTPHAFRCSCTTEQIRGASNLYHVKELLGLEAEAVR